MRHGVSAVALLCAGQPSCPSAVTRKAARDPPRSLGRAARLRRFRRGRLLRARVCLCRGSASADGTGAPQRRRAAGRGVWTGMGRTPTAKRGSPATRPGAGKPLTKLPAEMQSWLRVYAAGVNAWTAAHREAVARRFQPLGVEPEPWTPADCLLAARAVFRSAHRSAISR